MLKKIMRFLLINLVLIAFLSPVLLDAEEKKSEKGNINIYIMITGVGYKKVVVEKLEDFFRLDYNSNPDKHVICLFQTGKIIKGKENHDPFYYVKSYSKNLLTQKIYIAIIPYALPDPRKAHHGY